MRYLTTGDVCEIASLDDATLNYWCRKDIVEPARGSKGHGYHRQFTLMQAVGIAFGAKVRRESGAALSFVGLVVRFFGDMEEATLLKAFKQKRTYLFPVRPLGLCAPWSGHQPGEFDVKAIYDDVTEKVVQIERRLKHHVGGRVRGLAGAGKK